MNDNTEQSRTAALPANLDDSLQLAAAAVELLHSAELLTVTDDASKEEAIRFAANLEEQVRDLANLPATALNSVALHAVFSAWAIVLRKLRGTSRG